MKYILIALSLISFNSFAQYSNYGSYGSDQQCGPEVNFNVEHNTSTINPQSTSSYGSGQPENSKVNLGVKWRFDGGVCKDKQKAQALKDKWAAQDAKIANLNKKIEVCSRFSRETAPHTIKQFCGDLVGAEVKPVAPESTTTRRY